MRIRKEYMHTITGEMHGEFTLCVECSRVYKTEAWVNSKWNCPMGICAGTVRDAIPWRQKRKVRRPNSNARVSLMG